MINMGTEIRSFPTLKDMTEYITEQLVQHKDLFEDYSQWLGSLLRSCEVAHKDEDWYQKSAALQKSLRGQIKKAPEPKKSDKKSSGKGKGSEPSCWVQSGDTYISSTEQGQTEILFEAIEKISKKIQEIEKFKSTIQQLERIGLGKTVNYIVYFEDDVPKKIVINLKENSAGSDIFRFATDLSVPDIYGTFYNG